MVAGGMAAIGPPLGGGLPRLGLSRLGRLRLGRGGGPGYYGIYVGPGYYGRRCYSPRYGWHPCYYGYRY
jgi:hypothetical protein